MAAILIVDDEPVVREPIAHALKSIGHEVVTAPDGRAAIGVLSGQLIDLVVLDVRMPRLDGIGLLRHMRARPQFSSLPVILLTGESDRQVIVRARELGVDHYLLKSSFEMHELLHRVTVALGGESPTEADGGDVGAAKSAVPHDASAAPRIDGANRPLPTIPQQDQTPLKPIIGRAELVERVEACAELKAMSPTVSEVARLARSPNGSVEEVAQVIKRDPVVAVKVLRLANSAAYLRETTVDTVDKAAVRMGLTAIGQAVLNLGVIDQFLDGPDAAGIDPRLFWEHSIACGLAAARIARESGSMSPEIAFTAGLIHDVGRMIYAEALGDEYSAVIRHAEEGGLPLEAVERRMLLMSHAEIMERILHKWRFPRDVIEPVTLHHHDLANLRRVAPRRIREVATLAIADRLVNAMLVGSSANDVVYPVNEQCRILELRDDLIGEIASTIREETDELKFAMMTAGNPASWPDARAAIASRLNVPFRPAFASAQPEADTVRLFCDQITDSSSGPPNILVMHAKSRRELPALSQALLDAELNANAHDLPLLLLSPDGRIAPDSLFGSHRRAMTMAVPFPHRWFADVARSLLAPSDAKAAA
jgi:putative nucleotidyltransferase with HDIG domain